MTDKLRSILPGLWAVLFLFMIAGCAGGALSNGSAGRGTCFDLAARWEQLDTLTSQVLRECSRYLLDDGTLPSVDENDRRLAAEYLATALERISPGSVAHALIEDGAPWGRGRLLEILASVHPRWRIVQVDTLMVAAWDEESVHTRGSTHEVWWRYDYLMEQTYGRQVYQTILYRNEIDCDRLRIRFLEGTRIFNDEPVGVFTEDEISTEWMAVPPESTGEKLYDSICGSATPAARYDNRANSVEGR